MTIIYGNVELFSHEGDFLCNYYQRAFNVDGIDYDCVERYYQAEKARHFQDVYRRKKIMDAEKLEDIRWHGRRVQNFNAEAWKEKCRSIMLDGVMHKFTQNPDLLDRLMATGNRILAQASSWDHLWGIGLSPRHPDAFRPSSWPGSNWLGGILAQVRDLFRPSSEESNEDVDDDAEEDMDVDSSSDKETPPPPGQNGVEA